MNKKTLIAALLSFIVCLSTTNLFAYAQYAYAGLDLVKTDFIFQENYGHKAFGKKKLSGFNAFAGHELPADFFLEFGYQMHQNKNQASWNGGDYYPGAQNTINYLLFGAIQAPFNFNSQIKQRFPYSGLGWNYFFPNESTYINALAGISIVNIKGWFEVTGDRSGAYSAANIAGSRESFAKTQALALFRIGLNHTFSNALGVRLTGTLLNLDRMKIKSEAGSAEIRFKNSISIGLGLFYGV